MLKRSDPLPGDLLYDVAGGTLEPSAERAGQRRKGPRMTATSAALLLLAVVSAGVGQVMLRHGMQAAVHEAQRAGGSLAFRAAVSPWVLGGLSVFVGSAVAWLTTLSRVPLSVAYPFNAFGYIGILLASVFVLHERATPGTWAGSVLVVCGLILVATTQA